ncbi:MAG: DUF4838 domain-containing protein [Abditibacteriota bacterium]|nr:DUF4838 domain-containing protein [Abditibacteriota bacterium]
MKSIISIILLFLLSFSVFSFDITKNGEPAATVVLSENATDAEKFAASELISYIEKITGAKLSTSNTETQGNNIFIGSASHIDTSYLKKDGIIIKCNKNSLILNGEGVSGSIYSVYTFLDDYLGVKFFSPTFEYIPKNKSLSINNIDLSYSPCFESREVHCKVNNDNPMYGFKLKLNGRYQQIPANLCKRPDSFGGGHTFQAIIPWSKYGQEHPEWFSEINGVRITDKESQLCLTNEEMIQEMIKNVLGWVESAPDYDCFSITQNDNNLYCQCEKCKALTEQYGHSGAILTVVNRVADAVAEKAPGKFVDTFAYAYSREIPKGDIKPRDNVIMRLCSTDVDVSKPFDAKENQNFYKDLSGWSKLSDHLNIWDYIANFWNYVILHPNYHVLQKNLQLMRYNNVFQVFEQYDGSNIAPCMGDYKRYITSKLLWNPDIDAEKETKEFFKHYYGPASKDMEDFLSYINNLMPSVDYRLLMNRTLNNPYFTTKNWVDCFKILNKALKKTDKNSVYYERVYRDYLCFYGGFVLADSESVQGVVKAKVLPFKDIYEGIDAMNEFLPKHGVTRFSEDKSWADGVYAQAKLPEKQGTVPDICKNLKDNEWIEMQEDYLPCIIPGDYGKTVDDPKASNGKAAWVNPKYIDWFTQKPLSFIYFDKTLKYADIYVECRTEPKDKTGNVATCYIWNSVNDEILRYDFAYNDESDKEYKTIKIGEIDFEKTDSSSIIFFCGVGDENMGEGFYIDRVFFVLHR